MAQVLAGLWHRDTHDGSPSSANTLTQLKKAARATKEKADQLGLHAQAGKLRSIFLAPEFLFTRPDSQRDIHDTTALSREKRDWILGHLEALATSCPSMLLMPGTIVFKEDIKGLDPQKLEKARGNLEHAIRPGAVPAPTKWDRNRQRDIKNYVTWESRGEPYANNPAYEGQSERELSAILYRDRITELTPGERTLVQNVPSMVERSFLIKNRTYVFFDGARIFSYGKKINADDYFKDRMKGIFIPGRKNGVVSVDGRTVGFEICADHDLGTLLDHLSAPTLDLHLICSAEVPNKTSFFAVREGGYVLHASASGDYTKAFQKLAGRNANQLAPLDGSPVAGLSFYLIDI